MAILDAENDYPGADVTGVNVNLNAGLGLVSGGIGIQANFLEVNADELNGSPLGVLTALDNSAPTTAGIFITEVLRPFDTEADLGVAETSADMKIGFVQSNGDISLATQNGSLVDARNGGAGADSANVIGNTIDLYAPGGTIGAASGGNDLEIDSQHLAYGTVGARATNSIHLTETTGASNVVLLESLTSDLRFTVRESAVQGEDLNLLASGSVLFLENAREAVAHGLIHTPLGSILLRVGDNITTDGNSEILAGHNIDVYGDFQRVNELSSGVPVTDTPDPGWGTTIILRGEVAPGSVAGGYLTRVFGNSDADTITFDRTHLGGRTRA